MGKSRSMRRKAARARKACVVLGDDQLQQQLSPSKQPPDDTKSAQPVVTIQSVDIETDVPLINGDTPPREEPDVLLDEAGVNGTRTPTSASGDTHFDRLSVTQVPELAESTGDVAEKEADDFSVAGGYEPDSESMQDHHDFRHRYQNHHLDRERPQRLPNDFTQDGLRKRKRGSRPRDPRLSEYPPLDNEAGRKARARERQRANAHRAGGIRFAPWNIPFRRRLQIVVVMFHCLSIALGVSIFFFLCAIPLFWPIVIPYLINTLTSKAATDGTLRSRSERFRRLRLWKLFADYFPIRLHKTHDLVPTRKYIFGYHPHGIISHGAFAAFATDALGFSTMFPGITNSLLTLDSNFRIPIYRDYILAFGIQSVSRESIVNLLTKGGLNGEGMGRAVTIVVGGARESLEAEPGTTRLILAQRRGFVKLALRTGADLVPVLAFGENDLYDQVSPRRHPRIHRLQMWVLKTLKFTLPFLHGRGLFNYDVGLMPYRAPVNVVVGRPIPVRQVRENEVLDDEEVARLHEEYIVELMHMWETYKDVFVPERKEELKLLDW
ncbi:hypothetical protein VTJ49DRAFT_3232 [Mycothermus thermophilus]|uniref:diacylglycerol O-acyltransferase n=1 Tax=Humicola insolens TaxID=85995 RepID=A0ABR3V996_HUMIN